MVSIPSPFLGGAKRQELGYNPLALLTLRTVGTDQLLVDETGSAYSMDALARKGIRVALVEDPWSYEDLFIRWNGDV